MSAILLLLLPRTDNMKPTRALANDLAYASLLRGINVGGHNLIKMERLRQAYEALGFGDVKTYVQSGNVVFKAPATACELLAKKIENKVLQQFGIAACVIVKTRKEVNRVIKDNPLVKEKGIDTSKLHVTFLAQPADQGALKLLDSIVTAPVLLRSSSQAIYLYCPDGYGGSKLTNNLLEKVLSCGATTRNWKTVNKLYEMIGQ